MIPMAEHSRLIAGLNHQIADLQSALDLANDRASAAARLERERVAVWLRERSRLLADLIEAGAHLPKERHNA